MNPIVALLTFRAFRPDPCDVDETISARFKLRKFLGFKMGQNRLLVVSAGRNHWRAAVATLDHEGVPTLSDESLSPPASNRDGLVEWLREYGRTMKVQHVAVGVGYGFSVSALSAVTRLSDTETMKALRTEPGRLLGDNNLSEDINCIAHHPEVEDSSLRFKIRAAEIAMIREVCVDAGFLIARITCEQAQLIGMAYAAGVSKTPNCRALLVALPSSYVLLHLDAGGWHSPNFDPARDENTLGQIEAAIREALPTGGDGGFAYIDAGMPGVALLIEGMESIPSSAILNKPEEITFLSTLFN